MQHPTISIIVPVYNTEKYLPQCIDSILKQTYGDFELLLINDGSTDQSGNICEQYAVRDRRIRVFHQHNQGVSSARNKGIELAQNEWLCIIDSDDYLDEDYLKAFVSMGRLDKNCLNLQGWHYINEKKGTQTTVSFPALFAGQKDIGKLIAKYQAFASNAPWGKLFHRDFIREHGIYFPPHLPVREDAVFSYSYRLYVESICLIPHAGYYYRLPRKRVTASHQNYQPEVYLAIQRDLFPLISAFFKKSCLSQSEYEKEVVSYFKNQNAISLVKSLYAYPIPSEKRRKILCDLFRDKAYFKDPAFQPKLLLRLFKNLFDFLPIRIFDFLCFVPFDFYYKYIRKVK